MGRHPSVRVAGVGREAERARELVARSDVLHLSTDAGHDDVATEATDTADVCLLALDDPAHGERLIAAARAAHPHVRLLVLGPAPDRRQLVAAVAGGADGWLPSDTPRGAFEQTVTAVAQGGDGFSRGATQHLIAELRRLVQESGPEEPADELEPLTPREREIVLAVRAGRTTREIATALSLSDVTVRWHAGRATKKLEAHAARAQVRPLAATPAPADPQPAPRAPARARLGRTGLTPAELRIALLVTEGLNNRQIAEQLFISRHTVESHLKQVFAKLEVRSRVELTRVILASAEETA
jgi:DNA-binding NarL/FixJ family response regulator